MLSCCSPCSPAATRTPRNLPWQDCGADGHCIEPADRMDAISATIVFEAVPCVITGIAEE